MFGMGGEPPSKRRASGEGSRHFGIERERVALRHPTGHGGRERLDEFAPHVEETQARRPEQILQRAGDEEVDVQRFHVDRAGAAILIAIQKKKSALGVGDLRDRRHVRPEPVDEGDVRQRHDARPLIDGAFIAFGGNGVVDAVQKVDLGPARALREPDVPHGRKFVLAHHHFVACHRIEAHSRSD